MNMVCLDKHVISLTARLFLPFPTQTRRNLFRSISNPSSTSSHFIQPEMHPNAARNARTTAAHRKASTRTPQPQDKPKEGECYAI